MSQPGNQNAAEQLSLAGPARTGPQSQHTARTHIELNCIDQWGNMLSDDWPIRSQNNVTDSWRVNGNKSLIQVIQSCTIIQTFGLLQKLSYQWFQYQIDHVLRRLYCFIHTSWDYCGSLVRIQQAGSSWGEEDWPRHCVKPEVGVRGMPGGWVNTVVYKSDELTLSHFQACLELRLCIPWTLLDKEPSFMKRSARFMIF